VRIVGLWWCSTRNCLRCIVELWRFSYNSDSGRKWCYPFCYMLVYREV